MGVIKEDFDRCTSCNSAYFVPAEVVLIAKGSDYDSPRVIKRSMEYKCASCGYKQYEEA